MEPCCLHTICSNVWVENRIYWWPKCLLFLSINFLPCWGRRLFCSTSLLLASTRWVQLTLSSLWSLFKSGPSINLCNIELFFPRSLENFCERGESNPGLLGAKQEHYPLRYAAPRGHRLCSGFQTDAILRTALLFQMSHGIFFPPEMIGLLPEQISELKLTDENEERVVPSGGSAFQADPLGRRNGKAPKSDMKEVLVRIDYLAFAISSG